MKKNVKQIANGLIKKCEEGQQNLQTENHTEFYTCNYSTKVDFHEHQIKIG